MLETLEPISVLGVGNMGAALASAFLENGHPVTVWNRTIEKAQPLVSKGAQMSKSPAHCVQSGTIILISLASDEIVQHILSETPSLLDRTVINFTTSRPQWEIETANLVTNQLQASGYLHGWTNSLPLEVKNHQATVTYSGPKSLFEQHKHICQVLGKALWLSDDHKKICMLENAALSMVAGLCSGFFQSLALAGAAGYNTIDFTQEVILPLLPILQDILLGMAKRDHHQSYLMSDDSVSESSVSVGTMLGLVSNARETAETSGVSARLFEGFHDVLRQAAESGDSLKDASAVIQMLRRDKSQC